jgi:alkaline phosphatase
MKMGSWVSLLLVVLGGGFASALGGESASAAPEAKPPRNVILFVGDGMGVAVVTAARIHKGALEGLATPAEGLLIMEGAPRGALVHTWSADNLVTDSAAAITALVTGHKVPNAFLSAMARADGGVDSLTTLLELAEAQGLATGLVTTTRITHATPAGLYAHEVSRYSEESIAAALVPGRGNPRLRDGVEVILGGGYANFLPTGVVVDGAAGRRTDGRNLPSELAGAGYTVVRNGAELDAAVAAGASPVLGLFTPSHMSYVLDRERAESQEPSLPQMTRAAIRVLSRNPNGFFLLVEGGKIDHALHEKNAARAVAETIEFDAAIGEALLLGPKETVVLVTADHDHTMVLAGSAPASGDVFAEAGKDRNGVPYTVLLFATGAGGDQPPPMLTPQLLGSPDFHERGGLPTGGETHGGMDVPLFFWGPSALRDSFGASIDNTDVFRILARAIRGD